MYRDMAGGDSESIIYISSAAGVACVMLIFMGACCNCLRAEKVKDLNINENHVTDVLGEAYATNINNELTPDDELHYEED
jgi:hypothetical protein